MSKIDDQIQQIKTQFIGNTGARVPLVEGPDDACLLTSIFCGERWA